MFLYPTSTDSTNKGREKKKEIDLTFPNGMDSKTVMLNQFFSV